VLELNSQHRHEICPHPDLYLMVTVSLFHWAMHLTIHPHIVEVTLHLHSITYFHGMHMDNFTFIHSTAKQSPFSASRFHTLEYCVYQHSTISKLQVSEDSDFWDLTQLHFATSQQTCLFSINVVRIRNLAHTYVIHYHLTYRTNHEK
jgi:hypothetical protein